jgi:indolepyruvate decarboxylase
LLTHFRLAQVTKVKKAVFADIRSTDVMRELASALRKRTDSQSDYWQRRAPSCGIMTLPDYPVGAPPSCDGVLAALQSILKAGDIVMFDTFTLTFGALPMRLPAGVTFHSQSLWGSIGAALPMSGGAASAVAHDPARRVILLIGDGCLHMTATHLGTMLAERKANCGGGIICIVINNKGYQIEKLILKRVDAAYNEIPNWRYTELPHAFGASPDDFISVAVDLGRQLMAAMHAAVEGQAQGKLALVEVRTPPMDVPAAARYIGHGLPGF